MATKYISVQHLAGGGSRDSGKMSKGMGMVSFIANIRGSIHLLELDLMICLAPLQLRIFWEDASGGGFVRFGLYFLCCFVLKDG